MRSPLVAVLALVVSMASIQVGASLAKQLFPLIGAAGTTALRVVFAAAILLVVWRPWGRTVRRADLGTIALYGTALGAMNLSFYVALRTLPLGLAVAIEFTGPLAVAVLASRRRLDFLWALLAAAGIVLVLPLFEGSVPVDPVGVVWALVAGACWALYIVFGRRAGSSIHGGTATSLGMLTAALVVVPFGAADAGAKLLDPALLPVGLAVAVLSSALPYSLEMVGLKRLPAQTFGVLMSLEPALASLAGWLILREHLDAIQLAAIGCIMVASVGTTLTSGRA